MSHFHYAEIILPLPLAQTYTYGIPESMAAVVRPGMRVVVHFGARKFYTGIVYELHDRRPDVAEVKEISELLDTVPTVLRSQLKLWEFVSSYYRSFLGDVYKAALPGAFKLESATSVVLNADYDRSQSLSESEWNLVFMLSDDKAHELSELNRRSEREVLPIVKRLIEKQVVLLVEELKGGFKPKTETFVTLNPKWHSHEALEELFVQLKRSAKQLHLLMYFLDATNHVNGKDVIPISKQLLLSESNCSPAILSALVGKQVLCCYQQKVDRMVESRQLLPLHSLTDHQQMAYTDILEKYRHFQTVLLHGVTSSGKTEIYAHLIQETLRLGKQVLYLVPEIALTTQLSSRLKRVFGDKLMLYHSRLSDRERVEGWERMLSSHEPLVVLGARSAVFLPYSNLGLVVVDEEHDPSFKQMDPAPRYHARNVAIKLASLHDAKCLLGSATPSVESYANSHFNKYGLVELLHRYADMQLPKVETIDLKLAYKRKQMNGHFSDQMCDAVNRTLSEGKQVILFQNRRGYAPYVECKQCAWVPACPNCDVSLTYHKYHNKLTCHYCGYTETMPTLCPTCKTDSLSTVGFGTEQVEQEVQELFPEARSARMDLDTTKAKGSYEKIIGAFERGDVDILVGTQMISKGLDFDRVGLVGVLNADNLLHYPDFRSHERAFQMLTQVSGRAGRKGEQGRVLIQTSSPDHPILRQVVAHNYPDFFFQQIHERFQFNYPPYHRLIRVVVKHKDQHVVVNAANVLAQILRESFNKRVLGPDNPPVSRIQLYYIRHILLKIEVNAPFERAKELIDAAFLKISKHSDYKGVMLFMDVDPM